MYMLWCSGSALRGESGPLLTGGQRPIPIVFRTNVLDQFLAGREFPGHVKIPWFCECSRVFDHDVDDEMREVGPAVSFDDVKLLGVRKAIGKPALVVESNGVDDQRVTFPLPN